MAKPRPNIDGRLSFESTSTTQPLPEVSDPLVPVLMVSIKEIESYTLNPRTDRNPRYDEIKSSIRVSGLETALPITRRPGDKNYTLRHGGNTRLRILQELFEETGDEQFLLVPCKFRAWQSESANLISHLSENDQRGELRLVDRARAVRKTQQLIEEEAGRSLSQRALSVALEEHGYKLTSSYISRLWYLLDVLLPAIPKAVEAGMGGQTVVEIRKLDGAARSVWNMAKIDGEDAFKAIWATVLQRCDGNSFDTGNFQRQVSRELSTRIGVEKSRTDRILHALLNGTEPPPLVDPESASGAGETDTRNRPPETQACPDGLPRNEMEPVENDTADPVREQLGIEEQERTPLRDASGTEAPAGSTSSDIDLTSLRTESLRLAIGLAQRNHIADQLCPLTQLGLGFIVTDVPDAGLINAVGEQAYERTSTLWWHLVSCSEVTVAPVDMVAPLLPKHSILRQALESGNIDLILDHVATLDPGQFGNALWQAVDEDDWTDLVRLMRTYRAIRQSAREAGITLWENVT